MYLGISEISAKIVIFHYFATIMLPKSIKELSSGWVIEGIAQK